MAGPLSTSIHFLITLIMHTGVDITLFFFPAHHHDDLHGLLEENSSRCSSRLLSPLSPSLDTSCPSCLRAYDSARHRKLIDSRCNHARCYECLFREDDCRMCARLGIRSGGQNQQGSPGRSSGGSGGRGRESGFQSYAPSVTSINSALPMDDLQSQYSFSMGSEFSETPSEMMISRNDLKRRSLGSFSRAPSSIGSRRSLARRSVFLPSVSRVNEMASIRESNGGNNAHKSLLAFESI